MELPLCCGAAMKPNIDLGRFTEAKCQRCGDVIYIKKFAQKKPVLLDD